MSESEWIPRLMQEKVFLERKCIALEMANEKLAAELAELKAKMEGVVLVPVELIEHVKHARKLLGGNGAPEWQREKLRQKLTDLLANAMLAPQRPAIVAALQAECKGLEDEVNKLERNLAAAPSKEGEV